MACASKDLLMFESDVISDSGKTRWAICLYAGRFESDVISDSGKTLGSVKYFV